MGVHYLWSILAPIGRQVQLSHLVGKTLAVDLSGWVCQALNCHRMSFSMHKPHLRNLLIRIQHIYHLGINLVFVVDGEATKMKWHTMDVRAKADGFTDVFGRSNGRRSRLQYYVTECCQMLDLLGIPYLKSRGEAEAFCALLNSVGMVHGVLTDDTDALLYGALTVYKSVATSGSKVSSNSVMCYEMSDIEKEFGLSRDSLVGLALLLGCDYLPEGVHGIGRETVAKLIQEKRGVNLLERFAQWKSSKFDSAELEPIESFVYKKALPVLNFPNADVIEEFKVVKDIVPSEPNVMHWKQPDFYALQHFICSQLSWEKEYVNKKILVLMTQWVIRQHLHSKHITDIQPLRILKHRVSGGVHLSEVEWTSLSGVVDGNFCTIEMQSQFKEAFPTLYAEFMYEQEEKAARKKTSKKKKGTTEIQKEVLCAEHKQEKAIKKTSKRKKDTTGIQFDIKEASPTADNEQETTIKKTSKKKGIVLSEASPIMCAEHGQEMVTKKTSKKKKDTTEVKEASPTSYTGNGQENVIKKTSKKKKDTAGIQSEISPTLCAESQQEKKTSKMKKAGTLGGKRSPLKDKNQKTLDVSTERVQSLSQQRCSFSSYSGSDSEDEFLPLFERIHLHQTESTPHDCIQYTSVKTSSLEDPIVIED